MASSKLSPAAQAILDATSGTYGNYQFNARRKMLAAALRVAVNEVFPDERDTETDLIRSDFLHIASELENTND